MKPERQTRQEKINLQLGRAGWAVGSRRLLEEFLVQTEVVTKFRARPGLIMAGQGDSQDERKEQEVHVSFASPVHRGFQERRRADASRRALGSVHRRPARALRDEPAVSVEAGFAP